MTQEQAQSRRAYPWMTLERFGDAPALLGRGTSLSYRKLAREADAWVVHTRAQLPETVTRPLVLIETTSRSGPVIAWLGALRAGWPVILLAEDAVETDSRIADIYRPNILCRHGAGGWTTEAASPDPVEMHPDLALLLSTSGTTGAPKLVRLSAENIAANAASIISYLALTPSERAITTLPFHYSYGLSVLQSHLFSGAGVILTEATVIDTEFWQDFGEFGATSLALVPVQFELLDKSGFAERDLPGLRYITQAGGRLEVRRGARFAALAGERGWRFFIMYGQTEAAPRISYVPPEDVADNLDSIGRAVPGGRLSLRDGTGREIAGAGIEGELVYEGPNVMMGYASGQAELALGDQTPELRTGDIAERRQNGYFRITGRARRFIKLFGLRVGLDEVEAWLREDGVPARCSGIDGTLVAFTGPGAEPAAVLRSRIAARYKLPESAIRVEELDPMPLLASGKVDYAALTDRAREIAGRRPRGDSLERALRRAVRGREIDPAKSFIAHGADSLSYLEVQRALAVRLGHVPPGWETRPLGELLDSHPAQEIGRACRIPVPADLIWRVTALLAVISLHATSWHTGGGAFLLLVLTGWSLGRFQMARLETGDIAGVLRLMLLPIMVCYYALLTGIHIAWKPVDPGWFLLLGNFRDGLTPHGLTPYWFVCLYAQLLVLFCLPFLWPWLRGRIAAAPFIAGLALLGLSFLAAWALAPGDIPPELRHRHPLFALQLLALGWSALHAQTVRQQLLVTALLAADWALVWAGAPVTVSVFILAGTLSLIWRLSLPMAAGAGRRLMWAGSLAMFVYLGHAPVIAVLQAAAPALPDAARFAVTVVASFALAAAMKTGWDIVAVFASDGLSRLRRRRV